MVQEVVRLPLAVGEDLRICKNRLGSGGKRICVVTGTHGDELEGQYVAWRLNRLLMQNRLDREKHRLALCVEKMKGLSPLEKLSHGYSYIQNQNGENIRSIRQVSDGTALEIYVSDGRIRALVTGSGEEIK